LRYSQQTNLPDGKIPGRMSYPDIVLKWEVTKSRDLYNWHAVINGQLQRKNGSVVLLAADGMEAVRWHFSNAWPSKWDGPTLNAMSNEVAIESLTITCERQEQASEKRDPRSVSREEKRTCAGCDGCYSDFLSRLQAC
jgi:phage tail-like protein